MQTIPFPQLCSQDYTPFSSKADNQALINLYRERIQSGDGEFEYCLIKTPGLVRAIQPSGGNAQFRGSIELNDHVFVVVDDMIYDLLYTIDSGYTVNATYGPIFNDTEPVVMAVDSVSLLVVSGGGLYAVNSGLLTSPGTPVSPIGIAFLRGYWVIVGPAADLQVFYFSTDGLTWSSLDFQSAEGAPNYIVTMIADHQELWLIGNRITQVFTVGTDPNTPFIPRTDAVIMQGTAAPRSVVALKDALFWLGRNVNGERTVVAARGFNPENISTYATSNTLRQLAVVDDAIGMAYQLNGHEMYRLTFPTAGRTLEFDATENDWHEVAFWNVAGGYYERHRGNTMVAAFGKILVGDHTNGWLYEMSPDVYDDDGVPIRWLRRTPHLTKNHKRVSYSRLEVTAETGVGL